MAIVADYTRPISLSKLGGNKKVVFYPGSTIGNFEPKEAAQFLKQLSQILSPGDRLLIGVDLQKDPNSLRMHITTSKALPQPLIKMY